LFNRFSKTFDLDDVKPFLNKIRFRLLFVSSFISKFTSKIVIVLTFKQDFLNSLSYFPMRFDIDFSLFLSSTGSPWSTPTQSEIGEAESQLKYLSESDLKAEHKLMVRELGDGEPCENILVSEHEDPQLRHDSVKGGRNMSVDDKERRGRNKSKSPLPTKARKASLSPTKGKLMDPSQSNGDKKGAKGRLVKQQSLPQDASEEQVN
jgi:hypothetical protein